MTKVNVAYKSSPACAAPVCLSVVPAQAGSACTGRHVAAGSPKNRLWLYRKKMGYSQKTVAQLLGHKSPSRICGYEQGKCFPGLQTALKLEIILGTPLRELYSNIYKQFQREINHQRTKLSENAQDK